MTPEQFSRWRDFSLRMARACYSESRRPSGAWIAERVEEFIDEQEEDADRIVDWDCTERPPGSDRQSVTYCVSDQLTLYFENLEPSILWRLRDAGVDEDEIERREDLMHEQWQRQFRDPVACCVRAGLDMAAEPSAGVIGFSVGDIRAMYPEGIPTWLNCQFQDPDGAPACLSELPSEASLWL